MSPMLFDDVLTTGGHFIAAYRKLSEMGKVPTIGLAIGRTCQQPHEKMINIDKYELEVEDDAIDWDDIF